LAGWDSRPLKIVDFHGILIFWYVIAHNLMRTVALCAEREKAS